MTSPAEGESSLPRRQRAGWWAASRLLVGLLVATWAMSLLSVVVWQRRDSARHASAIVVMGAAQYAGRPSPVLRARIDHALALYARGLAPRLIFTGGRGEGDTTSEAAVGRRYALRHGVAASAIEMETEGRTTSESMRAVAALMEKAPSREVILVSDGFHMLRLTILARRFGLVPYTSPARSSPIGGGSRIEWRYVLLESVKAPLAFFLEHR